MAMQLLKPSTWACWALLTLGMLVTSHGAAWAEVQAKPKKKPQDRAAQFSRLDKDNNRELTASEFVTNKTGKKEAQAKAAFKRRDRNGDGKLSLSEFTAEAKKKPKGKKAK
jgi:hypothetical protein